MNLDDPYLVYYHQQQLGHGVSSVFRGTTFQRGHGLGSFLGGLLRTVAPLIKSGASTLGKEALKSGVGFLGDMVAGSTHPRVAASARLKEFTDKLKRKADDKFDHILSGGGESYKKRRMQRVTPQSIAKLLTTRASKRKTSKQQGKVVKPRKQKQSNAVLDIFG